MSFFTDEELTAMRSVVADSLPDTATVLTRTQTTDTYGGQGESWSGTRTVCCRLQFVEGDLSRTYTDAIKGAGVEAQQLYVVTLPHDAAITKTDRLVINGCTYDVVTDPMKTRSDQLAVRVLVKEV